MTSDWNSLSAKSLVGNTGVVSRKCDVRPHYRRYLWPIW